MSLQQLGQLASRLNEWLFESALPLWWEAGADHSRGGFEELLDLDGHPPPQVPRRARVQSRQSYVYATAGTMGWSGPWREAAPHGIDYLIRHYRQSDGQFCTLVSHDGEVKDSATLLYDQAFALLAMASVIRVLPERTDLRNAAHALYERTMQFRRHPAGGFVESASQRFHANPHMHFLEAALAWCEIEPGTFWDELADHIASLSLTKFIDQEGGFLREYFDENWNPAPGELGHVVEPGHQYEWAWLLDRWGKVRKNPNGRAAALRLYEAGLKGVDPVRDAAVHALSDDFKVTVPTARLWAQTERVKASVTLAEPGDDAKIEQAVKATNTLLRYLDTPKPGLWRDRFEPGGTFAVEPAPASSFYHITCCIECLNRSLREAQAA